MEHAVSKLIEAKTPKRFLRRSPACSAVPVASRANHRELMSAQESMASRSYVPRLLCRICERTAPFKKGVSTATKETPLDPPLL